MESKEKFIIVVGLPDPNSLEENLRREQIVRDYYPNVLCCDGKDDQNEVQTAIDALPPPKKKGGRRRR